MWGVFITFVFIYLTLPWRTAQQPTPVFLPGEFHGQKSLAGCSPWDRTESDTTEATAHACMHLLFSLSFWNREESDANKWEWEQRVETVSTSLVTWLFSMCVCVCMGSVTRCVHLFVTPWIVACQAPLSMGFARQEYWSRLQLPPPPRASFSPSCPIHVSCIPRQILYHWATWEAD